MKILITIIFLISGCGLLEKREPSEQVEAEPSAHELYRSAFDRLKQFVSNGFIISRYNNGKITHMGEAILWNGVALSSLTCLDGEFFENRLIKILNDHSGGLVRFEPLGEYENGREITIDGAIGFYHGVSYRLQHCKTLDKWRKPWIKHLDYLEVNEGKLNKNAEKFAVLPPEFTTLRDAISHKLGLRGKPHTDRIRLLESEITLWTTSIVISKSPAYPLSLSLLTLQGLEFLGYEINGASFCKASKPAKIPDLEFWCGQSDLSEFLDNFEFNKWEYKFQRASWELPDGKENLKTPAIDFLRASVMKYKDFLNGN